MPTEFRTVDVSQSAWKMFPRHEVSEGHGDLTGPVAKQMRDDIAEFGVMLRPVVLKRDKGGLCVLDGWQMYQACIATDVMPKFVELLSGISDSKYAEIMHNNRKHQDAKEKAKLLKIRKAKLKEDVASGTSVKDAAAKLGISRTTAHKELKPDHKKLPRCERCERVNATGDDCPRCQLLRMDVGADEPPAEPPVEEVKAPPKNDPPPALLDALFVTVPGRALEAFEVAAELAHLCHDLDKVTKALAKILAHKVGARAISPTLAERLRDARGHLWQARPTHVCAYCQGNKDECEACHGQGWQPGHQFQQAPPEMQDAMKAIGAKNVPI